MDFYRCASRGSFTLYLQREAKNKPHPVGAGALLDLSPRNPGIPHLFYHIDPKGSGELRVEFLTWVETVRSEEGHIQAPILKEKRISSRSYWCRG